MTKGNGAIFKQFLEKYSSFVVIQAENPDGDSLGSALALEDIIANMGKTASLHCPVDIPKYLRYFHGWDRVDQEFDYGAEAAIIVDTASSLLLSKTLEDAAAKHFLEHHPVLVIDHHAEYEADLTFEHQLIAENLSSTAELLASLIYEQELDINAELARSLMGGILSDTLGLTVQNVTSETFRMVAKLTDAGASVSEIETARRELSRKSQRILGYKGRLIERIEYHVGGKVALVHIPWEEIREYSDEYNPNVLILEEMRLVEDVDVCCAIKTYPDGRLTGKLRTYSPVAAEIAGFFGGGGHAYAAGFRVYDEYDKVVAELIHVAAEALERVESTGEVQENDP